MTVAELEKAGWKESQGNMVKVLHSPEYGYFVGCLPISSDNTCDMGELYEMDSRDFEYDKLMNSAEEVSNG